MSHVVQALIILTGAATGVGAVLVSGWLLIAVPAAIVLVGATFAVAEALIGGARAQAGDER